MHCSVSAPRFCGQPIYNCTGTHSQKLHDLQLCVLPSSSASKISVPSMSSTDENFYYPKAMAGSFGASNQTKSLNPSNSIQNAQYSIQQHRALALASRRRHSGRSGCPSRDWRIRPLRDFYPGGLTNIQRSKYTYQDNFRWGEIWKRVGSVEQYVAWCITRYSLSGLFHSLYREVRGEKDGYGF